MTKTLDTLAFVAIAVVAARYIPVPPTVANIALACGVAWVVYRVVGKD